MIFVDLINPSGRSKPWYFTVFNRNKNEEIFLWGGEKPARKAEPLLLNRLFNKHGSLDVP
jgi:hypothetical protein